VIGDHVRTPPGLSSSRKLTLSFCVPFSGRIVAVTETLRPTGSSAFTQATTDSCARGGFVVGTGGIAEATVAAAIAVAATSFTPA
jgi:hypothetical protein